LKATKKDSHLIEIAKSRVLIEDGRPTVMSSPGITRCPVHFSLSGSEVVTIETVKRTAESMIRDEGMFTPRRKVRSTKELVPFGASEMLMSGLRHGTIDCAIVVCDCAGSVITTRPEVVQGIGRKMTGLVRTSPIPLVIERLRSTGAVVFDPIGAKIDQVGAASRAFRLGHSRIAITVSGSNSDEIIALRRFERESGAAIVLLAVHNSGIDRKSALLIAQKADLVWSCASGAVRRYAGGKAILQVGVRIPVFAMTERGKELVLARIRDLHDQLLIAREKLPRIVEGLHPQPQG
jgi:putative methanogenesis marker protein 8